MNTSRFSCRPTKSARQVTRGIFSMYKDNSKYYNYFDILERAGSPPF